MTPGCTSVRIETEYIEERGSPSFARNSNKTFPNDIYNQGHGGQLDFTEDGKYR